MPNSITVRGFILTYGDKLRWRWHGGRIIYSIFLKLSVYFFYNLMAHFLTAAYRSKLVSDKNSIRICSNIIGQSGRQIIPYYMDFNVIQKNDALDIEKCGIFFLLFYFSLLSFHADIWFADFAMSVNLNCITMNDLARISPNVRIVRSS